GSFPRLEPVHRLIDGSRLGAVLASGPGDPLDLLATDPRGWPRQTAPPRVAGQIRRDAVQGISPVRFVLVACRRAQEPVEGFLQQIVGRAAIAGKACEVSPDSASVAVVESPERILVHHEFRGRIMKS